MSVMSNEPPGTVVLETSPTAEITLQPVPTSDPNQALNWASWRKHFNFFQVCFFTLMAFTTACVSSVMWGPWQRDYGWTIDQLNNSYALSVAGLGLGCPVFIPFVHKFGKRPVYLVSSALVVACSGWQARMMSIPELYASMFIQGMAVSVSETIVQMSVADLYFVHQRGTANGIYMLMVAVGNFLILVPSGYITLNLGWRWVYIIVAIISGVQFAMTLLFFEETAYEGPATVLVSEDLSELDVEHDSEGVLKYDGLDSPGSPVSSIADKTVVNNTTCLETSSGDELESQPEIPFRKPRFGLLPLWTYHPGGWGAFFWGMVSPLVTLFAYPLVTFCAFQYGCLLAWLSMAATTSANSWVAPPYNFSAVAIGNINIAPFIGMILGCVFGGWFNDKTIIWLSKRNNGVFEPEFRLYNLLLANFSMTVGILLFGIPVAHGVHWMAPTVGFACIAFGFGSSGAIVVTYLLDCYEKIAADAFIGVVVIRNAIATAIILLQSPWEAKIGLQSVYISAACFTLIPLFLTIPVISWGKQLRRLSADRYLRESVKS